MPVLSTNGHTPGSGPVRGPVDEDRADDLVAPAGRRQRVLADRQRADRLLRRSGRQPLRPQRAQRPSVLVLQGRGAIKGGPALVGGVLYFGDYSGHAYAVRAVNGHQVWAVGTDGAHFGFGSGQFYATPAVAFGRVYMGNTDGRVYSFGARTGALAWATGTGAYVYASAAVADPKGLGPTRLHRLLRRQLLCLQRTVGSRALAPSRRRQDLRVGDRAGQHRLLLGARQPDHGGARHGDRPPAVLVQRRSVHADDRRLPRDLPRRLQQRLSDAPGDAPGAQEAGAPPGSARTHLTHRRSERATHPGAGGSHRRAAATRRARAAQP